MKHFKTYDFTLGANGSQAVYAVGRVLTLLEADGPVSVRVDGGSAVVLKVGQGLNLNDGDTWSEITVQDVSGAPNAGKLFVGAGAFTDQNFNADVNLVGQDPGLALVTVDHAVYAAMQGKSYMVYAGQNAAINQYAQVFVWNPVGSGVIAQIDRLVMDLANKANASNWGCYKLFGYSAVVLGGAVLKTLGVGSNVGSKDSKCLATARSSVDAPTIGFTGPNVLYAAVGGASSGAESLIGKTDLRGVALGEGEALVLWALNGATAAQQMQLAISWSER